VVLVPVAITVYLWVGSYERGHDGPRYSSVLVAGFLLLSVVTVSPISGFEDSSPAEWREDTRELDALFSDIQEETDISTSSTVLYLADGTPTYYLGAKSYLRYYYPLPVQRAQYDDTLRETEIYRTTYSKVLAYDGRYILVTDWIDIASFPRLEEKLSREYCVVYRGSATGIHAEHVVVYDRNPDAC